jgi:membrane protein
MTRDEGSFRDRLTERLARAKEFLRRDLWEALPAPRSRRWLYQLLRMGVLTWEGLVKTDVFTLAAALTFKVVFSLIPFLAVILAFVKAFGGLQASEVRGFLVKVLTGFLGDQASADFDRFIGNVNATAVGVAGFAVLLYTSFSLLDTVEKSFNRIWGIQNPRALLRRFTVYWTILTVTPVALVSMLAMKTFVESNRLYVWLTTAVPWFGKAILVVGPFVFAWILFTLVFVIIPNTRVRLGPAFLGALVAGTAWNVMTTGYVWYNARVVTTYAFYGSLGAVPVFLLWVYLSWIVVLFGAEIAFAFQHVETYRRQLEGVRLSPADRDRLALVIAREAAAPFSAGGVPPTAEAVAAKLDAPSRVVHEIVYLLMSRGVLREVSSLDAKDPGLVPARDPASITLRDVLSAVRGHGDPFQLPDGPGIAELYRLVDVAEEKATAELAKVTLKDLAAPSAPPPGGAGPAPAPGPAASPPPA